MLRTGGNVPDGSYKTAIDQLGDVAVVEITAICGYYTLVAYTLNVFRVQP